MDEETIPAVLETSSFSLVVFNDVPPSYPPNTAITCWYTVTGGLQPTSRDWIGIFKVGWQSATRYYSYEWVEPCLDQDGPEATMQKVVFRESYLPKDDGEFYQFCYVDSNGHVKGASTPFCFGNPAETSLDSSLEKDLLVVTTQEQANIMEKEKEGLMKTIESLKEENQILKNELGDRLQEMCRMRKNLEDLKSKENLEAPLSDEQSYHDPDRSLTSLHENYEEALQKIKKLKQEISELQQEIELRFAENLKLNTSLKEMDHNYNKLQDHVKLLQVDVQNGKKDNEKLHAEIEELLRMKKTLEEKKDENKAVQASISENKGEDNTKLQIKALLTQLTEARGLLRSELQNCKEAMKRAESAERELKEVKKKLVGMNANEAADEKHSQIQAQLQQAQNKISEMAQTSNVEKQDLIDENKELQVEVARLRRAVFDYQVASVAAVAETISNPQSPPASSNTKEQTHQPDSHFYNNIDGLTGDPSRVENKMRVCQHCHESFPGISEDELAQHEQCHKVCPFCTLICDDWEQQQFEDHVYSHED